MNNSSINFPVNAIQVDGGMTANKFFLGAQVVSNYFSLNENYKGLRIMNKNHDEG